MRYARIDTAKGTIEEFRDFDGRPVDIPHKNVQWLPVALVSAPSIDPARQVLEGPFYEIVSDAEGKPVQVSQSWRVRDKTPAELDADLDAKIARIDEATAKALANMDARLTALEGKQARGFSGFLRSLFGG